MIKQILFVIAAVTGYGLLCGADTETIRRACMYWRETPNSACGIEQVMHGLGSIGIASGLTGLAGSAVGSATDKLGLELLTDAIIGYLVISSPWWTDNVANMF